MAPPTAQNLIDAVRAAQSSGAGKGQGKTPIPNESLVHGWLREKARTPPPRAPWPGGRPEEEPWHGGGGGGEAGPIAPLRPLLNWQAGLNQLVNRLRNKPPQSVPDAPDPATPDVRAMATDRGQPMDYAKVTPDYLGRLRKSDSVLAESLAQRVVDDAYDRQAPDYSADDFKAIHQMAYPKSDPDAAWLKLQAERVVPPPPRPGEILGGLLKPVTAIARAPFDLVGTLANYTAMSQIPKDRRLDQMTLGELNQHDVLRVEAGQLPAYYRYWALHGEAPPSSFQQMPALDIRPEDSPLNKELKFANWQQAAQTYAANKAFEPNADWQPFADPDKNALYQAYADRMHRELVDANRTARLYTPSMWVNGLLQIPGLTAARLQGGDVTSKEARTTLTGTGYEADPQRGLALRNQVRVIEHALGEELPPELIETMPTGWSKDEQDYILNRFRAKGVDPAVLLLGDGLRWHEVDDQLKTLGLSSERRSEVAKALGLKITSVEEVPVKQMTGAGQITLPDTAVHFTVDDPQRVFSLDQLRKVQDQLSLPDTDTEHVVDILGDAALRQRWGESKTNGFLDFVGSVVLDPTMRAPFNIVYKPLEKVMELGGKAALGGVKVAGALSDLAVRSGAETVSRAGQLLGKEALAGIPEHAVTDFVGRLWNETIRSSALKAARSINTSILSALRPTEMDGAGLENFVYGRLPEMERMAADGDVLNLVSHVHPSAIGKFMGSVKDIRELFAELAGKTPEAQAVQARLAQTVNRMYGKEGGAEVLANVQRAIDDRSLSGLYQAIYEGESLLADQAKVVPTAARVLENTARTVNQIYDALGKAKLGLPDVPLGSMAAKWNAFGNTLVSGWTNLVLTARPGWQVINYMDNTFRLLTNGYLIDTSGRGPVLLSSARAEDILRTKYGLSIPQIAQVARRYFSDEESFTKFLTEGDRLFKPAGQEVLGFMRKAARDVRQQFAAEANKGAVSKTGHALTTLLGDVWQAMKNAQPRVEGGAAIKVFARKYGEVYDGLSARIRSDLPEGLLPSLGDIGVRIESIPWLTAEQRAAAFTSATAQRVAIEGKLREAAADLVLNPGKYTDAVEAVRAIAGDRITTLRLFLNSQLPEAWPKEGFTQDLVEHLSRRWTSIDWADPRAVAQAVTDANDFIVDHFERERVARMAIQANGTPPVVPAHVVREQAALVEDAANAAAINRRAQTLIDYGSANAQAIRDYVPQVKGFELPPIGGRVRIAPAVNVHLDTLYSPYNTALDETFLASGKKLGYEPSRTGMMRRALKQRIESSVDPAEQSSFLEALDKFEAWTREKRAGGDISSGLNAWQAAGLRLPYRDYTRLVEDELKRVNTLPGGFFWDTEDDVVRYLNRQFNKSPRVLKSGEVANDYLALDRTAHARLELQRAIDAGRPVEVIDPVKGTSVMRAITLADANNPALSIRFKYKWGGQEIVFDPSASDIVVNGQRLSALGYLDKKYVDYGNTVFKMTHGTWLPYVDMNAEGDRLVKLLPHDVFGPVPEQVKPVLDRVPDDVAEAGDLLNLRVQAAEQVAPRIDDIERQVAVAETPPVDMDEYRQLALPVEEAIGGAPLPELVPAAKQAQEVKASLNIAPEAERLDAQKLGDQLHGVIGQYQLPFMPGDEETIKNWIVWSGHAVDEANGWPLGTTLSRVTKITGEPWGPEALYQVQNWTQQMIDAAKAEGVPEGWFTRPDAFPLQPEQRAVIDEMVQEAAQHPAAWGLVGAHGEPLFQKRELGADFQGWFKDSAVRDAEGRPLFVYHGTLAEPEFAEFQKPELGYHFALTPSQADEVLSKRAGQKSLEIIPGGPGEFPQYVNAHTYPLYASVKDPLPVYGDAAHWNVPGRVAMSIRDTLNSQHVGKISFIQDLRGDWIPAIDGNVLGSLHPANFMIRKWEGEFVVSDLETGALNTFQTLEAAQAYSKDRITGLYQRLGSNAENVTSRFPRLFRSLDESQMARMKAVADELDHLDLAGMTREQSAERMQAVFRKHGFDGVAYINEYEEVGTPSLIAFSPDQIKSPFARSFTAGAPSILEQNIGEVVTGFNQHLFNPFDVQAAHSLIGLLHGADADTAFEEWTHHLFKMQAGERKRVLYDWASAPVDMRSGDRLSHFDVARELDTLSRTSALTEDQLARQTYLRSVEGQARQADERLVVAFRKYVMTGVAPNATIQPFFEEMKKVLIRTWQSLKAFAGVKITPEVRQAFDEMLGGDPAYIAAQRDTRFLKAQTYMTGQMPTDLEFLGGLKARTGLPVEQADALRATFNDLEDAVQRLGERGNGILYGEFDSETAAFVEEAISRVEELRLNVKAAEEQGLAPWQVSVGKEFKSAAGKQSALQRRALKAQELQTQLDALQAKVKAGATTVEGQTVTIYSRGLKMDGQVLSGQSPTWLVKRMAQADDRETQQLMYALADWRTRIRKGEELGTWVDGLTGKPIEKADAIVLAKLKNEEAFQPYWREWSKVIRAAGEDAEKLTVAVPKPIQSEIEELTTSLTKLLGRYPDARAMQTALKTAQQTVLARPLTFRELVNDLNDSLRGYLRTGRSAKLQSGRTVDQAVRDTYTQVPERLPTGALLDQAPPDLADLDQWQQVYLNGLAGWRDALQAAARTSGGPRDAILSGLTASDQRSALGWLRGVAQQVVDASASAQDVAMQEVRNVLMDYETTRGVDAFLSHGPTLGGWAGEWSGFQPLHMLGGIMPFPKFARMNVEYLWNAVKNRPQLVRAWDEYRRDINRQRMAEGLPVQDIPSIPINLGSTQVEINPMAIFSAKAGLQPFSTYIPDYFTDAEKGLAYVRSLGFSISPGVSALLASTGVIRPEAQPFFSILPQGQLLPPALKVNGEPVYRAIERNPLFNTLLGVTRPQDMQAVGKQLGYDALDAIGNAPPSQKKEVAGRYLEALMTQSGTLWDAASETYYQAQGGVRALGYMTGLYPKVKTDTQAAYEDYKHSVRDIKDAIQTVVGFDNDTQVRFAKWMSGQPETAATAIVNALSPYDAEDRALVPDLKNIADSVRGAARRLEYETKQAQLYKEYAERKAAPVGIRADADYEELRNKLAQLDADYPDVVGDKYVFDPRGKSPAEVRSHVVASYLQLLGETKPQYGAYGGDYNAWQADVDKWYQTLPQVSSELWGKVSGAFQAIGLSGELPNYVRGYVNAAQMRQFESRYWTVDRALSEVWQANYYDGYWDAVQGKTGPERLLAEREYTQRHPVPDAKQLYGWLEGGLFQGRFALADVKKYIESVGGVASVKERLLYGKSPKDLMADELSTLLARLAPGRAFYQFRGALPPDVQRHLDTFTDNNYTALKSDDEMRALYQAAAPLLKALADPSDALLREWVQAKKQYNELVAVREVKWRGIGELTSRYAEIKGDAARRAFRAEHPEIRAYYDWLYHVFGPSHALWAKYYSSSESSSGQAYARSAGSAYRSAPRRSSGRRYGGGGYTYGRAQNTIAPYQNAPLVNQWREFRSKVGDPLWGVLNGFWMNGGTLAPGDEASLRELYRLYPFGAPDFDTWLRTTLPGMQTAMLPGRSIFDAKSGSRFPNPFIGRFGSNVSLWQRELRRSK